VKLTCLVTAQPAEGESIEIEFTCDGAWKHHLSQILQLVDNRLSEINLRIIDDVTAKDSLTLDRYHKLMAVVNTQFPYRMVHADNISCTDIRILVRKMTNNREQIALRFDLTEQDDIQDALYRAFSTLDKRMIDTNKRDLQAYELFNSYQPEDKQPLQMILDCLYGRADATRVGVQLASHALVQAKKDLEASAAVASAEGAASHVP
jgi:hypothetical protein